MSEETILKNSFFGGYKKREVIRYVDNILEENEKKIKEMEKQMSFLIKENKQLKRDSQEKSPISFPSPVPLTKEEDKTVSVKNQMDLPEGSYIISENRKMTHLPDPHPIYQVKRPEIIQKPAQDFAPVSAKEIMEPADKIRHVVKDAAPYVAMTKEKPSANIAASKQKLKTNNQKQLKAQLLEVNAKLKAAVKEKQILMAKLEYCTELLLQLYHKD